MVAADRVLWIDFDSTQMFPGDRDIPLSPKQEMWFRNEDELMDGSVGDLVGLLILIAYGPGNYRLIIISTAQGLCRGKAELCMVILL